ncbi:MAG: hypothetical protein U1F35_05305 [Steroidobacteraceae bacterium]
MLSANLQQIMAEKRARGQRATRAHRVPKVNKGEATFAFQCRAFRLPDVAPKWKMVNSAGTRTPKKRELAMWEFDFAFLVQKVLVEIDGGIWIQGAHAHPTDITRNMTKQNDAAHAGFITLRFTPAEVKSGHAIAFTQRVLATRGWKP